AEPQAIRERYSQSVHRRKVSEDTLLEIRRLAGLESSYAADCENLRVQLKGLAPLAENNAPGFNQDEIGHLGDLLARLRGSAVEMQTVLIGLRNEVVQVIHDNPGRLEILIVLRRFEEQWGSFGERFLNPADLQGSAKLGQYLETWLTALHALDI